MNSHTRRHVHLADNNLTVWLKQAPVCPIDAQAIVTIRDAVWLLTESPDRTRRREC